MGMLIKSQDDHAQLSKGRNNILVIIIRSPVPATVAGT